MAFSSRTTKQQLLPHHPLESRLCQPFLLSFLQLKGTLSVDALGRSHVQDCPGCPLLTPLLDAPTGSQPGPHSPAGLESRQRRDPRFYSRSNSGVNAARFPSICKLVMGNSLTVTQKKLPFSDLLGFFFPSTDHIWKRVRLTEDLFRQCGLPACGVNCISQHYPTGSMWGGPHCPWVRVSPASQLLPQDHVSSSPPRDLLS